MLWLLPQDFLTKTPRSHDSSWIFGFLHVYTWSSGSSSSHFPSASLLRDILSLTLEAPEQSSNTTKANCNNEVSLRHEGYNGFMAFWGCITMAVSHEVTVTQHRTIVHDTWDIYIEWNLIFSSVKNLIIFQILPDVRNWEQKHILI